MKEGDILMGLRRGVNMCIIIKAPTPPKLWTVEYMPSGVRSTWSKTHLKKYYTVIEEIK